MAHLPGISKSVTQAELCPRLKKGDNLVITMSVVCDGKKDECAKLQNDFNVMTAKMQAEVNQQIADQKK